MRKKIHKLVCIRYFWWTPARKRIFAAAVTSVALKELQGLNVFVAVWQEAKALHKNEEIHELENKIIKQLKPARVFFMRHYRKIKSYEQD